MAEQNLRTAALDGLMHIKKIIFLFEALEKRYHLRDYNNNNIRDLEPFHITASNITDLSARLTSQSPDMLPSITT